MNLSELALRPGQDPARAARPAFLTVRGPVSNADFQRRVFALAGELTRRGVRPSEKILLRMVNSADFAAAFLNTIWTSAVPVLHNSQLGRSELEHIIALCEPTALL